MYMYINCYNKMLSTHLLDVKRHLMGIIHHPLKHTFAEIFLYFFFYKNGGSEYEKI